MVYDKKLHAIRSGTEPLRAHCGLMVHAEDRPSKRGLRFVSRKNFARMMHDEYDVCLRCKHLNAAVNRP